MTPSLPSALDPVAGEERVLVEAFACFTQAAQSLEGSYRRLQGEVGRLRQELEEKNRDLSRSLAENERIRRHLKEILEGLPCGVLVTGGEGEISLANPEARRLLGLQADGSVSELGGAPGWAAEALRRTAAGEETECRAPHGAPEAALAASDRNASTDSDEATEESQTAENQTAENQVEGQWISVWRAPLAGREEAIFILRDTTEARRLKRAEAALERRQALAETAAVLAHEIRNPLGSLELFAALLAESESVPERRQWAEQIQAGVRALAATVNNVLHLHCRPASQAGSVDLGRLLQGFGEFLSPLARQSGVALRLAHQLDGVQVMVDAHRLEQVLFNLALNALRCMSGGGTLTISGGRRRLPASCAEIETAEIEMAEIEIEDTGPGIAPENLLRVFAAGFTTRPGSPGLGLAVAKTILEQHGGTISVENRPGQGATFRLRLPAQEAGT